MRLYIITFNDRTWETTDVRNAWEFARFLGHSLSKDNGVHFRSKKYQGEEIKNIVAI